jgi:hypothetical protein
MTDYKNELRSVLYDFLGDFKEKRYLSEGNTDEAIAKLEALLSQHSKKRELEAEKRGRIAELQRIHKNISVTEWNDSEYEYWCENCTMLLIEKDDICACERLTTDRINKLTNREEK